MQEMTMSKTDSMIQLTFPAHYRYLVILSQAINSVAEMLQETGAIEDDGLFAGNVYLAVHEVCTNIIDHAYGLVAGNAISVHIGIRQTEQQLQVILEDSGQSFDPFQLEWPPESWFRSEGEQGLSYQLGAVPEPDFEQERGRGLFLVAQLLECVTYQPGPKHNRWCLMKEFSGK
jgi:serine/threonine-protein kinase RsbW